MNLDHLLMAESSACHAAFPPEFLGRTTCLFSWQRSWKTTSSRSWTPKSAWCTSAEFRQGPSKFGRTNRCLTWYNSIFGEFWWILETGFAVLWLHTSAADRFFPWRSWLPGTETGMNLTQKIRKSLGSHLEVTWKSLGSHLEVTWKSLGSHLEVTWKSLGYYWMVYHVNYQWTQRFLTWLEPWAHPKLLVPALVDVCWDLRCWFASAIRIGLHHLLRSFYCILPGKSINWGKTSHLTQQHWFGTSTSWKRAVLYETVRTSGSLR